MPERADLERRTTELLQRLIRFNTVNPPGNEQAVQEFLRDLLEDAGFECELLGAVEGRPNLVARMGAASDGPTLCLLGHVDTVLAEPSQWSADPWSGELRDGCVWGRGALDMKSQVAAEAAAALALVEEGWRPEAGELLLVFTCDEETGAAVGAQWLCREHPGRVRADLVVNEGAGQVMSYDGRRVYGVCVAEKGVFRFTLSTAGQAGHASVPRIGDNALARMGPLLSALRERRPPIEPTPEADALLSGLGLDSGDPLAALAALERTDPELAVLLEPLLGVSFTPTIIRAGEKINVIPAHAELEVDCRVPPGLGEDHVHEGDPDGARRGRLRGRVRPTMWSATARPPICRLMDSIRAFVEREDPGASVTAMVMTGLLRLALVASRFPRQRGLRLLPAALDGLHGGLPARARSRRADPGRGPGPRRRLLL